MSLEERFLAWKKNSGIFMALVKKSLYWFWKRFPKLSRWVHLCHCFLFLIFYSMFFICAGHSSWYSLVPEEVKNQDVIAHTLEMCFQNVFWKYVNPICGSIGQLIRDRLLTNEFLEPLTRKQFFLENVLKLVYRAIAVYKEDKKTKDEIESYYDN